MPAARPTANCSSPRAWAMSSISWAIKLPIASRRHVAAAAKGRTFPPDLLSGVMRDRSSKS
eukprot:8533529-Alexandrium_andersonii.AAC.1